MGMYTEFLLKAEVKENVSQDIIEILEYLFGEGNEPKTFPDHPFFECSRWDCVGHMSSFYHIPWYSSKIDNGNALGTYYIFSRSDLKNYEGEIEKFLDWAQPYLKPATGNVLGWTWYEENDGPTLIVCDR